MNRFSKFALFLLLCPLLLLPGCGQGGDGPAEVSATQGDFRATLTSARNAYDSVGLGSEEPLDFAVRVDYLGQEKEVHIVYGADLGYVRFYNGEGAGVSGDPYFTLVLLHGTLGPDEPFVGPSEGGDIYEFLGEQPAGSYVAKAHVSFDVYAGDPMEGMDQIVEEVELDLELPFEIR